ncbi:alpha/beta fold hydrolase [Arthrobacter sp. GCM10027362]|uniref:alpha/beta fold hydrolase n=1 Tax=Arthrobacter sp. GCM10027362 TaxID=3273379 RepID=UPI00363B566E
MHIGGRTRRLSVDGFEFGIETRGAGADEFALVHGIGMSPRYFDPLVRELAPSAKVHALHLPGFGRTRRPRRSLSMQDFGRLSAQALRGLGAGPAIVVGHSMGCQVAVEMALADPAAVRALVLLGPTTNRRERSAWRLGLRLAQDTLREPPGANWTVFSDYARCGPRWYFATVPHMIGHRLEERLPLVGVPVLLLRGEHDPIAPGSWLAELLAAGGSAAAAEVPGAPHVVMYRSPQTVARHCLDLAVRP